MFLRTAFIFVCAAMVATMKTNEVAVHALSVSSAPTKMNKLPTAILFDIDGTLVDSDPIHYKVFRELLLKEDGFNNNEPIDETFFRKWIAGRSNSLIMKDFFPQWSIDQREQWSILKEARFREVASKTMNESKMYGLDKLRNWIDSNDIKKAAVTNAPRLNAEAILKGIHYDTWFTSEYLIIGDECEKPKPDPCPYLTACKLLGDEVDPTECIVFEDSPSGASAGVAAGAYVIGILSGQDEATLQNAGCSLIIENFDDAKLWKFLDGLSSTDSSTTETSSPSSLEWSSTASSTSSSTQ